MTECNDATLDFSRIGPRAVVADFNGGRLTTDAGVLPLRELGERLGLFDALDRVIPDPRWLPIIVHDQKTMLAQRIIAIALGYEDLNDHRTLRSDPALQLAAGKDPDQSSPLASPPTLCRLEDRVDRKALIKVAEVLVDQFIASHPDPPEHLILDFDATDDLIHGKQEGRFFHGYYDHHGFLPLYVFCGDELLTAYLRPGDIDAAKVRDPEAVAAACRRLGLPEPVHGTATLFEGRAAGLLVRLPGWLYPVVCDTTTGSVRYDNYQEAWGRQAELDRLLQIYAVEKARIEARRRGHHVVEQSLADGSIRLTIQVGGAA